jgi:hypothetical protein
MRGILGLVSLLIIGVGAALYFTQTAPEAAAERGTYSKIEDQAHAAAAKMATDPQIQVDAATAAANGEAPSATNAPSSAPGR